MRRPFRECSSQALDGALGVRDELGADDADDADADRGEVVVAAEVAREAVRRVREDGAVRLVHDWGELGPAIGAAEIVPLLPAADAAHAGEPE